MKFIHCADLHLGSWRHPKLANTNTHLFSQIVEFCIKEKVDFLLIAGDLFNSSFPNIETLKATVKLLKQLQMAAIPVYIVAGSHDYSPSGKTILEVLEHAGLLTNVMKGEVRHNKLHLRFTVDEKTGAKLTGILGRRGTLEKKYFEALEKKHLEDEDGYKIFLFHTTVAELKPEGFGGMESVPLSFFPKRFNYYAGGHVHDVIQQEVDNGVMAYPGPLFPNSFSELEQFGHGGYNLVENDQITWVPCKLHETVSLKLDCTNKTPEEVDHELRKQMKKAKMNDAILLLRLFGTLKSGKPTDIDFKNLFTEAYQQGAHVVMKNTAKLLSKTFQEVTTRFSTVQQVEQTLLEECEPALGELHITQEQEKLFIKKLLQKLDIQKDEGERVRDFEERLLHDINALITRL